MTLDRRSEEYNYMGGGPRRVPCKRKFSKLWGGNLLLGSANDRGGEAVRTGEYVVSREDKCQGKNTPSLGGGSF